MQIFGKQTAPIYGIAGYLQFKVDSEGGDDGFLYRYATERHQRLEDEIRAQVKNSFGTDFEVLNVRLERGSVEIWVVLGAVGTFLMTFSRYESFVKSVNLLTEQLMRVFDRFFQGVSPGRSDIPISVTGSWQPSATVLAANQILSAGYGWSGTDVILAYLICSHASLLIVLLWLVIRHLR